MCDSDRIPREYKNVVEVAKTWRFVSFRSVKLVAEKPAKWVDFLKNKKKNDDISKFTFISNDK